LSNFTFIDLFAGIGGFHLGATSNGGKCIAFSEIDKSAIQYYCENHSMSPKDNLGDITRIKDLPKHDLLTAGVPCQSWSIAGRNLGFDDDRGQLWNDTIYLLKKSRPKAFIFENVKGLTDPRNKKAFKYILSRIEEAGYYASYYVLNSYDYGLLQNRIRVYIVGFESKIYFDRFTPPPRIEHTSKLYDVLDNVEHPKKEKQKIQAQDLFGNLIPKGRTKFQKTDELNDFFLFNDIRNGHSTIHSWELKSTTSFEKDICLILLKNRRKSKYGELDGNPLSLKHFQELNPSIKETDLQGLVKKGILKEVDYAYELQNLIELKLTDQETEVLKYSDENILTIDKLKNAKQLKIKKISFSKVIPDLIKKGALKLCQKRYEFKYTKISSGIFGINRIYLPISDIFSTLVASDTNDYISMINIDNSDIVNFKTDFIREVYDKEKYRKITKQEACRLQGFPHDFILPDQREKWMKLIGNSVSVPVVESIIRQIVATGIFDKSKVKKNTKSSSSKKIQDYHVQ
jgi:DNA (cytosine-5)-methyltransferase 1